jgi:hypothetical protein
MTPTLLRSWSGRVLHWTPRRKHARIWRNGSREVCQWCCGTGPRCGFMVGGMLFGDPCTRQRGHAGDHVCCVGREHARRWRHQKRKAA